ncbi:MAG: TolC family protein [Verrucomicrobia bacterium]|nr:MAG: TolC family protein [Verrucomicrobiota bacterium]
MFSIARKNPAARLSCAAPIRSLCVILSFAVLAGNVFAQESISSHAGTVTPLSDLLAEAEKNNPQVEAARQGWQAGKQVPSQVSTLPDPQFTLQHLSVGSPRPFAGYTNSDFAYIGFGVTQDIPYPGKLKLRGEIAKREADVSQQQVESVRRSVLADVKTVYFQLAYLAKTLTILESNGDLLKQIEQAADARYRSGMGTQQDVLQAQLQETKLVREIAMHHRDVGKLEAQLKQFLNRPQDSPDIEPADLTESPLLQNYQELLAAAKAQNPELAASQKTIDKQSLQVNLARKDFYPDFNVQYMWQRTDPTQFRAYYMLSFGVSVPIHRSRKQKPELAQAQAEELRARSEHEAQSQQVASELRSQYVVVQQTAELLKIHREGLSPQARSEFQAGLAAYQSNKQDFQAVLTAFLDVLHLDEEYWQNVAEYETAIARLEQITGLALR